VRSTSEEEPIGPVSLEADAPVATLSLEALELADRLVAGFLMAARAGVWQPTGAAAQPARYGNVGLNTQALNEDILDDASTWLKKLTLDDPLAVLKGAQKFGEAVLIAGAIVTVGVAVTAGSTAALPVALVSTVAFAALTWVPVAIATALHTGASMLDPQRQVVPTASPTLLSLMNGLNTRLNSGLSKLKTGAMAFAKGGSTLGKALGNVVSAASSWTSNASSTSFSWLKTCVSNPTKCSTSNTGADAGIDAGPGGSAGAGSDGGPPEAGMGECGQQQASGADTPQTLNYDVGTPCGDLTVDYNMQSVPDRIIVKYDGADVADTGCVSGSGTLQVNFCGQSSTQVSVQVVPNCNQTTGTAWSFTLNCPLL
jgi:hypothetical protein